MFPNIFLGGLYFCGQVGKTEKSVVRGNFFGISS